MYEKLLERNLKSGAITLKVGTAAPRQFGDCARGGQALTWLVKDHATMRSIARNWEFQMGETYMNGDWEVADGTLHDLLMILRADFSTPKLPPMVRTLAPLLQQWNRVHNSLQNVSAHYDLDEQLFKLFLDRDMHYSCAYFQDPAMDLEQAQKAKCEHIADKLLLKPGQRVLDIGCGWGSLALHLAQSREVDVLGITLSREQLNAARRRARELGVDKVHFELADYRQQQGEFDRIVSVGMFEHVGRPYYRKFYRKMRELLAPDGVALLHTIGRWGAPRATNPWIRRYIFPGGAMPSLSQIARATEDAELMPADVEVLRLHYAETLRAWSHRFAAAREAVRAEMGERFCRMWEFYLAVSEVAFRCSDLVVFQQQIASRHGIVPMTRDYLYKSANEEQTPVRLLRSAGGTR